MRGRTPFHTKTNCAERMAQTTLSPSKSAAPAAFSGSPAPRNKAEATEGGNKATATITPTKAEDTPVDIDRAAAAPEASASAIISGPIMVRETSSRLSTLTGKNVVRPRAKTKPMINPVPAALVACFIRDKSPKAVASAKAKIGPNKGAITMAAMTIATLSSFRPIAATIADRIVRTMKSRLS